MSPHHRHPQIFHPILCRSPACTPASRARSPCCNADRAIHAKALHQLSPLCFVPLARRLLAGSGPLAPAEPACHRRHPAPWALRHRTSGNGNLLFISVSFRNLAGRAPLRCLGKGSLKLFRVPAALSPAPLFAEHRLVGPRGFDWTLGITRSLVSVLVSHCSD